MDEAPFISVCIPAYQRTGFLKRLLDSISIQNYPNFEVVITDDSPGSEVQELVEQHPVRSKIRYYRNQATLGTPENWNEALRKAKFDWIKIMHDDDWFSGPDSLTDFASTIRNSGTSFYFSAYSNVYPDGRVKQVSISDRLLNAFRQNPVNLIAANRIGPPSVVIFKKDLSVLFDNRLKWLVDIDFYIRYLNAHPPPVYTSKNLIQIGISDSQVTQSSFGNRKVEIPERFLLNEKLKPADLNNLIVFDSWWRFIRNMRIRDEKDISESGYPGPVSEVIKSMIRFQKKIPKYILTNKPSSKILMTLHYLLTRGNLNKFR
jgi:glycosyltransferase involved in cell wall biosynthesis